MNYPVWDVPFFGSGWVIGAIAIVHVLISHFAVGGGLFLAWMETKAIREGRQDWLLALRGHAKFFLVLTGVFGALTGVGIWFAIGLASPIGTSALIHNFVFGWAIEWVVFLVELTLASAYYHTWGRVSDKVHQQLGWAYAGFSFLTLVLINGILTFKLTPSAAWLDAAAHGQATQAFAAAFFNAGYWPSLILRTLACLSLAGIWGLVFFAGMDAETDGKAKAGLVRWCARWLVPAYVLMPFAFAWYLATVPADHRQLMSLGISTIGSGAFTHVTRMSLVVVMTSATIAVTVLFLAWLHPRDLGRGHALSILLMALLATAATESVREFLRKPFVVNGYLYSNGVKLSDVPKLNSMGYMAVSPWLPQRADSLEYRRELGLRMYQGQCLSCHTADGYRSLTRLLRGRDTTAIGNILSMLHEFKPDSPYRKYMPQLVGTPTEIGALRDHLDRLVRGVSK